MRKPESITIRVTKEFKAILIKRAKEENRSITNYIEWLVMKDAKRNDPR